MFSVPGWCVSCPGALLALTLGRVPVSGGGLDLKADCIKEIKARVKCVKLVWQHELAQDGGTPAFVVCDGPDALPQFTAAVEVVSDSTVGADLLASAHYLLNVGLQPGCAAVRSLPPDQLHWLSTKAVTFLFVWTSCLEYVFTIITCKQDVEMRRHETPLSVCSY